MKTTYVPQACWIAAFTPPKESNAAGVTFKSATTTMCNICSVVEREITGHVRKELETGSMLRVTQDENCRINVNRSNVNMSNPTARGDALNVSPNQR